MEKQDISSVADKIAVMLNSAPPNLEEEDALDFTSTQVTFGEIEDKASKEEAVPSEFRRANINLLADVDEKYSGKKTSRKDLQESDDEINSANEYFTPSGDDDTDVDNHNDSENNSELSTCDEQDSSDNQDDESKDEDVKHSNVVSPLAHIKKGICVRNQMALWESFLEIRIQLQKCLLAADRMPTSSTYNEIMSNPGLTFDNKISETKGTLVDALDKLLLLQRMLLKQYPETQNLYKENEKGTSESEDNEVKSQSESERLDEKKFKKRKLNNFEHIIKNQHETYTDYRNCVLKKWNDKTRVILKGGTSQSVLDQIEYALRNKEKILKRTQLKRSYINNLGELDTVQNEEYCSTEVFNDDDFYHQLLKELIEVKSADVTDPVELSRQWIHLQNLRSKMKKKIDTRASKGRKIRYAIHNKLVGFMASLEEKPWTDEAKTDLFNSVFGKNRSVS